MRTRAAAIGAVGLALVAGPAAARVDPTPPGVTAAWAPRAPVMVVGARRVLAPARALRLGAARLRARGRSCAVGAGTPLAALEAARRAGGPRFSLRDFGRCSSSPRDAALLFVDAIGPDRNRGRDGWVYKVGRRAGTLGAGDLDARVRAGSPVLWFWCSAGRGGRCRRTLELSLAGRVVAPGAPVDVTVRSYDDAGRGRVVAGAQVILGAPRTLGAARATTGRDGTATLAAPPAAGRYPVDASADGLVGSFPQNVTVR